MHPESVEELRQVTDEIRDAAMHRVTTVVLPKIAETIGDVDLLAGAYDDPPRQLGATAIGLRQAALQVPEDMVDQMVMSQVELYSADAEGRPTENLGLREFTFTNWRKALTRLKSNLNLLGAPNGPKLRQPANYEYVSYLRRRIAGHLDELQSQFDDLNN